MKKFLLPATLVLLGALASCQSTPRSLPQIERPKTVEGQWVDSSGIVSTFQGGTFTTKTTDTNQLLASGTYFNVSPTLVEINMTSLVRNTQARVNCSMVSTNQLNCTTQTGSQFVLTRKSDLLGSGPVPVTTRL